MRPFLPACLVLLASALAGAHAAEIRSGLCHGAREQAWGVQ